MKTLKRNCPKCKRELIYSSYRTLLFASKNNCRCYFCSNEEKGSPFLGKKHTEKSKDKIRKATLGNKNNVGKHRSYETKLKMSNSHKGKILSQETKNKISKKSKNSWNNPEIRKKMLHNSKWINRRLDIGQLELLEKWNKLGFNFEPNYQIKTDIDLFYIDGYDKEKNVVLEYDSRYHNRLGQKEKDLIRQQKIIDILKPKKFWRYNKNLKNFSQIIENTHDD